MANIDLKQLDHKQLDALIAKAAQQKQKLKDKRREQVRTRLQKLAQEEGFSIEELFGPRLRAARAAGADKVPAAGGKARRPSKMAGTKVPPKYRNPEEPHQTWSGRGVQPRWFAAALAAGRGEEELRIKNRERGTGNGEQ